MPKGETSRWSFCASVEMEIRSYKSAQTRQICARLTTKPGQMHFYQNVTILLDLWSRYIFDSYFVRLPENDCSHSLGYRHVV